MNKHRRKFIPGKMSVGVKRSLFKKKLNKKIMNFKSCSKQIQREIFTPKKFKSRFHRSSRLYLAETAQSSNRKKEIMSTKKKPKRRKHYERMVMVYTPGKGRTPKKKLVSPIKVQLRSEARSIRRKQLRAEREARRRKKEEEEK